MTENKKTKQARRVAAKANGVSYQAQFNAERRAERTNLAHGATVAGIAGLLAACDDEAAHHVIWVGSDGGVHVDPLPETMGSPEFEERLGKAFRFRRETCVAGNGYVGAEAAADVSYVKQLLGELQEAWDSGVVGYDD